MGELIGLEGESLPDGLARTLILTLTADYAEGREEAALLALRLRANEVSLQPGLISAEVHNICESVTSRRQPFLIFKWESDEAHLRYFWSPESFKYLDILEDKFANESIRIERWSYLHNPLMLREEAAPKLHSMILEDTMNPTECLPANVEEFPDTTERTLEAFAVTITARCNMSFYQDFCEKMQILEVSAQIEEGCLAFEVYTRIEENAQFLIYSVYRTEDDYQYHSEQSYSFFLCGIMKMVTMMRMDRWKRLDPYL